MVAYWDTLQRRHTELLKLLSDHSLERDQRASYQRELTHINGIIDQQKRITALEAELLATKEQLSHTNDADMKELFEQEIVDLAKQLDQAKINFENFLAPPDEHDNRSVFLEIRAGAGGQEAALFVDDLRKMYTAYALTKGWKVTLESSSSTDLGGLKDVILHIKGTDVFGHLKRESGVHRVQRVPATETQGRVHTSTVTVAVLPEAEDIDVSISPADLRIDVYRASGAGGQHVNTTDSAVRITHIPTGVAVACQEERSQHKNKAKAMKMLQSRILAARYEKHEQEMSASRKAQIGTGMRAEKVRTYNYPQNRVTDHQVDITLKNLDYVMEGNLDEIVDALRERERQERKNQFLSKFSH